MTTPIQRKSRAATIWYALLGLLGLVALAGLALLISSQAVTIASTRTALTQAKADTRAATANADKLYAQLLRHQITPAAQKPSDVVPIAGQNGTNGRDAPPVTDTQVYDQVANYCMLRVDCQGPPGLSIAGQNGTDGAPGAPGATGPQGPPGNDGQPGRGIVSGPTCQGDGTWSTTYTDGTTETQDGPCRIVLIP